MATTTNYGWTTPDDTALVKDGAAAIRTLGSSVDTTTKALNPETTLGDLAYRSSTANVKTRLGLGTAGQVLQVNSGATAPEWATPSSGGQTLLSTTALTGASVTISSISQSYNDLYIYLDNPYVNASEQLIIQPNSTTGLADWIYDSFAGGGTSTIGVTAGNMPASINLSTTSSPTRNNWLIIIYNYKETTYGKNFTVQGSAVSNDIVMAAGNFRTASAITELKITTGTPATRTFSGGQVRIYGVK
jgi:hypothetical protein